MDRESLAMYAEASGLVLTAKTRTRMAAADSANQSYPDDPAIPRPGDVIASKYRIEGVLGTGGMGVVLSARHVQLGQSVAIKLMTTGLGDDRRDEAVARFLREGQAAAGLPTDHVVRVYDVGTLDNGAPFMVMELLRGADLGQILESRGRLPIPDVVEYVLQACDAIEHAHAQGIVHRDLKPSNLFVTTRSDGTPHVKVLDFGISKALHGDAELKGGLTSTRSVLGSPFYMSPEQLRDAKAIDHRTDIWALGVILHELLSGEPAFQGDTLPGVAAAIAADSPAPMQTLRPEVPRGLEACILRCLEKSPKNRFQSVRELMNALAVYGWRANHSNSNPRISVNEPPLTIPIGSSSRNLIAEAQTIQLNQAEVANSGEAWQSTLQSHNGAPAPSAAIAQSGERSISGAAAWNAAATADANRSGSKKISVLLGLAAVLASSAALFVVYTRSNEPALPKHELAKPVATSITAGQPSEFNLILESSPSGAEVKEGGKSLGFTPLQLGMNRAQLRTQARTFTLSKPGFLPYTLVQSDSASDVRVSPALQAEVAVVTPTASAAPRVSASVVSSRNSSPRAAKPAEQRQKPVPDSPSPDIRMQR
jgi:serine/threonine-protein kinase